MMQPLPFFEFLKFVGCVNDILNISTTHKAVIFQCGLEATLEFPMVLRKYGMETENFQKLNYEFYVVDLNEITVKQFLKYLQEYETINPKARYLFIGDRPDNYVIASLLNVYILNFIFFEIKTNVIYTVFPYETGDMHQYTTELRQIAECQDGEIHLKPSCSLFPDKLSSVWKRSDLTLIYSYEAPYSMSITGPKKGIEMDLLEIILVKTRANAIFFNKKNPSFNLTELMEKGGYDIDFGNLALDVSNNDFTVPYSCDSTYWFVPQPEKIPKWKLAFTVFESEVIIVLVISFICISILWHFTNILIEHGTVEKLFIEKLWQIFTLSIEQGITLKMNYISPRILIFLILQLQLILNSSFKAKYTFFLSGTNYEKAIETLEEVMDEGLNIGSTTFLIKVYTTTPKVYKYIQDNFVECDTGPACLNRSAIRKDLAVLKPNKKVAYIRDQFTDRKGHHLHHRLPFPVHTLCNTFYIPKGHPMFSIFNRFVHLLVQHGFVEKIIAKYDQIIKSRSRSTTLDNPKLKFSSVKGPLFMTAVGLVMGSLVFLLEIFFCKRQ